MNTRTIPTSWKDGILVKAWPYTSAAGVELGVVARYHDKDGRKTIVPFFPRGENAQAPAAPRPMFGLDTLKNPAESVDVYEGEPCAFAARMLDRQAVTSLGGAQAAHLTDWTPLARFGRIDICPDNDVAGEGYARAVVAELAKLPGERRVRIVRLKGLPEGGDLCDWVKARVPAWDGFGAIPRMPGDGLLEELLDEVEEVAEPVTLAQVEAVADQDWPAPIPFTDDAAPAWPAIDRPRELAAFIDAVAQASETPIELSAMTGLAVLAASAQKKFEVEVSPGYREPLSLYNANSVGVGERKTAVLKEFRKPLDHWEREQRDRVEPARVRAESEIKTRLSAIEKLRRDAAKAQGKDLDRACAQIADLEAALPVVPACPRVWTSDSTPERLGELLEQNGERMTILSDEGGVLDSLSGGRYNGGRLNLDLLLQGHSGSAARVDRMGRACLLERPALSMGLMIQPQTLHELAGEKANRGRGLLARMLFCCPDSLVGRRNLNTAPIPDAVRADYHRLVLALLDIRVPDEPRIIHLSPGAARALHKFAAATEADMAPGGRLREIADWGSKLPGAVARIAGLLHVGCYYAENPEVYPVDGDTMRDAVALGEALTSHALRAFGVMGASPGAERAQRVLGALTGMTTCSRRDVFRALGNNVKRAVVDEVVEELLLRGYLRLLPPRFGERGRPREEFELHPSFAQVATAAPVTAPLRVDEPGGLGLEFTRASCALG